MSVEPSSNVLTLFEFPEDDPQKQPVIETLLWALEEVRLGKLCSIAIVGVSSDFSRSISWGEGVRVDQIPHVNGLLGMLKSDLRESYEEAIADGACSQDV